jgi:hypothetical protein
MDFLENTRRSLFLVMGVVLALGASGCGDTKTEAKYPSVSRDDLSNPKDIYGKEASIFGDGAHIFGSGKKDKDDTSGIGVNSFLWRASLDTVAFMPLASADPFGGVILTDWYSPPDTPNDRFKMNVLILDKHLRSDGVQVKVFKQTQRNGAWRDAAVPSDMGPKIEDAILTRARQLRVKQLGNG